MITDLLILRYKLPNARQPTQSSLPSGGCKSHWGHCRIAPAPGSAYERQSP